MVAGLVPAFAITVAVVGRYKTQREDLGRAWADRGERDMARSPALAIADFQTSLSYRPDAGDDRLRLAEALFAAGRLTEARAHLLTLWAEEPGDGRINLDLARLSASDDQVADAIRHYHAAIDGAWAKDAAAARRNARLELARLLIGRRQYVQAQSELIAVIDDLPPDPAQITTVGTMLVEAGADSRAIGLFGRALAIDPSYGRAALLAGRIQFRSGQYDVAHELLAQAVASGAPLDPADHEMLAVSARVSSLDFLRAGLPTRERARRVLKAVDIARVRLERCASEPGSLADPIADLYQRLRDVRTKSLRQIDRAPDTLDDLTNLVFDVEMLPENSCGPDSTDDRALQAIAGQRRRQAR